MLFLAIRVTNLIGCSKNDNIYIRELIKQSNWKYHYKKMKTSICRTSKPTMQRTISIPRR